MKLNYFLLLILSVCLTNNVFTQEKIVLDGVVLDYESKGELVYAHVYCKNLSIGTFTNSEGRFLLVVPESAKNEVFTVSCIGYYESEISVSSFNEDTIFLFPKTNVLEEVEIISEYKPKEILKKVYKKRKINYPYDDQYCCNAYYREYFKRNDTTVQMLELSGKIREKGMKYEPMFNTEIAIDTIYNFYRSDNKHIFSSLSFFGLFGRDGFKNSFNGTLQVDSVFFLSNEKHISITYIPKKSDTITYEAYESSVFISGDETTDEIRNESGGIRVVSTSQYNRIDRFVINLKDFALVEYYF
ncbi:MAG: carboxypeptidase-like regulatory domain-containing protein, partial [Bacteroidales bacterium]|nr:carboxypeptidase-like regulatory domain-containing protein [Bacteroidales bacterium]